MLVTNFNIMLWYKSVRDIECVLLRVSVHCLFNIGLISHWSTFQKRNCFKNKKCHFMSFIWIQSGRETEIIIDIIL